LSSGAVVNTVQLQLNDDSWLNKNKGIAKNNKIYYHSTFICLPGDPYNTWQEISYRGNHFYLVKKKATYWQLNYEVHVFDVTGENISR